jgi:hypothetical protein
LHYGVDLDAAFTAAADDPTEVPPCGGLPAVAADAVVFLICDGPNSFAVGVPAPDGTVATLDFEETMKVVDGWLWGGTYLLEQLLTTVFVNSNIDTLRLTLDGDCAAASAVVMAIACADCRRVDSTNTLLLAEEVIR